MHKWTNTESGTHAAVTQTRSHKLEPKKMSFSVNAIRRFWRKMRIAETILRWRQRHFFFLGKHLVQSNNYKPLYSLLLPMGVQKLIKYIGTEAAWDLALRSDVTRCELVKRTRSTLAHGTVIVVTRKRFWTVTTVGQWCRVFSDWSLRYIIHIINIDALWAHFVHKRVHWR